jgi:hypothetical protein
MRGMAGESVHQGSGGELGRRLREAGTEELLTLLRDRAPEIDVAAARQLFRNPYATSEVLTALAAIKPLTSAYEIRRDLALHPQTPQAHALRFLPSLFWGDLMRVGADVRIHPSIRRAADRYLVQRLPRLALGEKVSLARRCGGGLVSQLRNDPNPRVIQALLENPRVTEGLILPLASRETTAPAVLRLLAQDPRWGSRYPLRTALAKNPSTPVATALGLLPSLKKHDLKAVVVDSRLGPAVRNRARLLLGDPESRPGGGASRR